MSGLCSAAPAPCQHATQSAIAPGDDEVNRLVAVDYYHLAEQVTAIYETFAEQAPLPTTATVPATTVEVVGIDIAEHGEALAARAVPRMEAVLVVSGRPPRKTRTWIGLLNSTRSGR